MNCRVVPKANEELAGVTAIEISTAAETFSVVDPETVPDVAVIVVLPTPAPVAKPPETIVAIEVCDELQVAEPVRSCVLPSLYVPVAENCCVFPFAIVGFDGVTAIDTNVAAEVTVRLLDPVIVLDVALIVDVPAASAVAKPCVPLELLIVAIVCLLELQLTDCVRL